MLENKKPLNLSLELMQTNNPFIIPRNHKVEESLEAATNDGNLKPIQNLLKFLKNPYKNQPGIDIYQLPPKSNGKKYKTFCGT